MIEPVDPFQRRVFHSFKISPGTAAVNELSIVESNDRFGQRIVVGVADTADRGLDTDFSEALGVANR